ALVLGGPDIRTVLKNATGLCFLSDHAHRELIGVEMPWMLHARSNDIKTQPGKRVRHLVDSGQLETVGEKLLKRSAAIKSVNNRVSGDAVPGHERVSALHRDTARVIVRQ